jgi:hypothetical protein
VVGMFEQPIAKALLENQISLVKYVRIQESCFKKEEHVLKEDKFYLLSKYLYVLIYEVKIRICYRSVKIFIKISRITYEIK